MFLMAEARIPSESNRLHSLNKFYMLRLIAADPSMHVLIRRYRTEGCIFLQAEDGIRYYKVTGVRRVLFRSPGECPNTPKDMDFYSHLDIQSGPVHDMILDLVKRHVAVTSTLPVFEVEVPGRPSIQQRVLDALSPDARAAFLDDKVRMGDTARLRRIYGTDVSPVVGAFKKEMEFENAFVKAGGTLLAGEDPTSIGGVLAGVGDQREGELLVE